VRILDTVAWRTNLNLKVIGPHFKLRVTCKPYSFFQALNDKNTGKDDFMSRSRIYKMAMRRKTVRQFLSTPIRLQIVIEAIATACQAPSGANTQSWRFVVVQDQRLKRRIREVCEQGEQVFYRQVELGVATVPYTPSQTKDVERVVMTPEMFRLEVILPIGMANDLKNKEPRVSWQAITYRETWDKEWS
jgi:hypothetical protein